MQLQIIDSDGSIDARQVTAAAPWTRVEEIPLRDLAPRVRLWSRDRYMREVRARIGEHIRGEEATMSMLGSGDFHHLCVLLMEHAKEPITVIHIDNHPDWVRWAPRWHCGSWVNQALRLPQVRRVITLGPCSDDLVRPELKGANLSAMRNGRIALFPWRHAPSRVFGNPGAGPGFRAENGHLIWRNLVEMAPAERLDVILSLIETDAIWLSIDKDAFRETEALTNWDQGEMPVDAALAIIRGIGAEKRIVGADICGDYSPASHSNWFKRWEEKMDQPVRTDAELHSLERNLETNRVLLATIEQAAR